ncbi:TniB family NTP-binding protein [Shewanella vesiculosa]|uniref:TniB family NTP-binding protein n=1 Tax=Shewanella vesiculosa TaxID=518738 RepID=UPI00385066C3
MTPEQMQKIKQVKDIFIPTNTLKSMLDTMKKIREIGVIDRHENMPDCMFVTGETGVGKTTFIEQYLKKHSRYDVEEIDGERTIVPVLYCSLPKAKHPKPVVAEILRMLGDELQGDYGDVAKLTDRLVTQLKEARTELLIIDEFQHAIETTNKNVIQEIGEWFKIFINKARIPIVFLGVPWSRPVLEINAQLKRRVRKRKFIIPNYTLDTFEEFQMFLQKVEQALPLKPFQPIWQVDFAFRLFAVSKGNLSELMEGVIVPACIQAIYEESGVITDDHFIEAVENNTDWHEENNPLLIEKIENIEALQQDADSFWNPEAKKLEKRVIDATYAKVKFSDLNLKDLLSKR